MDKDIVKYNNQFNLSNLNELDKIEQNIFFSICSEFTKNKSSDITISLDLLKEKSKMVNRGFTQHQFETLVKSTNEKILKVIFSITEGSKLTQVPLFKKFVTDFEKECIIVSLNDCFAHYLYNIPEKIAFSRFELEMFLTLKSKYSKTLLRFLLQNFTGKWTIDFLRFREIMGFTDSYKGNKILIFVDKAIKEIEDTKAFTKISYEIEKARSKGSPIKTITFTYKVNNALKEEMQGQSTIDDYINQNTNILQPTTEEKTTSTENQIQSLDDVLDSDSISDSSKEIINTVVKQPKKDIQEQSLYDEPVIIDTPKTQNIEPPHPKCECGAEIFYRRDKKGEWVSFCKNNAFYGLGTCNHNNGKPTGDEIRTLNAMERNDTESKIYTLDSNIAPIEISRTRRTILKKFKL